MWPEIGSIADQIDPTGALKDKIYEKINDEFPQIANGTFGLFKGRNDTTTNSFYRVNNGENNLNEFLSILEFNAESSLPQNWWPNVGLNPAQTNMGAKGVRSSLIK